MGFLYCPSCGKEISEAAVIPACPNCYHPFDAKVWRETYEQKLSVENVRRAEEAKKRKQASVWKAQGLCPECGMTLEWLIADENIGIRYGDWEGRYCKTVGCKHSQNNRDGIPVEERMLNGRPSGIVRFFSKVEKVEFDKEKIDTFKKFFNFMVNPEY
jgi:predicted RNA-binding Zn-ribbon protein involved in translation (DUF1610 family)